MVKKKTPLPQRLLTDYFVQQIDFNILPKNANRLSLLCAPYHRQASLFIARSAINQPRINHCQRRVKSHYHISYRQLPCMIAAPSLTARPTTQITAERMLRTFRSRTLSHQRHHAAVPLPATALGIGKMRKYVSIAGTTLGGDDAWHSRASEKLLW